MHLSQRRVGDILEIELSGEWRGSQLPAIEAEIAGISLAGASTLRVTVPASVHMDLAGAWRLREWLESLGNSGTTVEFAGQKPGQIDLIDATVSGKKLHMAPPTSSESRFEPVGELGRQVTRRWESLKAALGFIGRTTTTGLRACTSWRRMRPVSVARHIYETGITAIPIVSLIAFLITLIIAYIAAQQARAYGAE